MNNTKQYFRPLSEMREMLGYKPTTKGESAMAATKATKAAKAAVKKTAAKKLTATEKEADKQATAARKATTKKTGSNVVETQATTSSAVGKNFSVKGTVSAGAVALSKYSAQLTRLASSRGHSVEQEIEIAIHDHVEKFGQL